MELPIPIGSYRLVGMEKVGIEHPMAADDRGGLIFEKPTGLVEDGEDSDGGNVGNRQLGVQETVWGCHQVHMLQVIKRYENH